MRVLVFLSFVVLFFLSTCWARDMIEGTSFKNEIFYSDPGQQIIRGIIARDLDHTKASPTITAGGVGSSYANIPMKSERGSSLNYQIEIHV